MTGRDWVSASLKKLGVLGAGESMDASQATEGLATLNQMLESWSLEGLVIHAITAETPLTLTAGDGTITLGAAGDITTRPISIEQAFIRDGTTDLPQLRILTAAEYAAIPDKSTQSTYPSCIYDDGGYPQRTITLYPVPSAAHSLVLFTKRQLTQIATLDTAISLPPGYERAMIYNGAIELAPDYSRTVSAEVAKIAEESKSAIKRANIKPVYMKCDAVPASGGGRYNIFTGGYE